MFRLTTFLKRAPDTERSVFVDGWAGALTRRVLDHPMTRRSVRRAVLNLPFDQVAEEDRWIVHDDFDGVAELWFDDLPAAVVTANALAADAGIAGLADELVDGDACVSWIGGVVEEFDAPGIAVKRIVAGQPREDLTLEAAQDYWLHEHSAFFKGYAEFMAYMLRYRPIYGIPTPGLTMRSARLMAMCADIGFRSVKDLSDAYREPRHAADMISDLQKFGGASGAITFTAQEERILFDYRG